MLELKDVALSFGEKQVLNHLNLTLKAGERIAVMGPSGCGKTSLLRVALSLQMPERGTVSCKAGRTAAVFQEPRLLPWRTAAENVNLVLSDREETMPTARAWLDKLELTEAHSLYPSELSGGMQQRVSIARALAASPELVVMDEPFKAMDDALRDRVVRLVGEALQQTSLLMATHSEEEARALGCRVLRYQDGRFL